ncbi:MAG: alpha-L-fucosidase [Flavitalea sp.]
MIKPFTTVILILLTSLGSTAQTSRADSIRGKMQWFSDAKLGIFIHWGMYAVADVSESWSFHNRQIPFDKYMEQMKSFTASKYDPEQWAALIKESGARYAVITTKHHDGLALWPTKQNHLSVVKNTPAKRDLLNPFYKALDKQGIKRGAYFSLIDWSYKDYPGFLKDSSRYKISDDPARWNRFRQFMMAQLNEVNDLFKPDLWWFDGDWEHSAEEWESAKIRATILSKHPGAIINSRLQGYGDYETPEQNFPVSRPKFDWWELCMTTNDNWGYRKSDTNWKTPFEIISIFADVVSNGGNMLLDIGPKEDGTIPPEQVHILKELGQWNSKHSEAIFNSIPGLPQGHFYGASTLSKDSSVLYLFIPNASAGNVMIKGLKNKIIKAEVLGTKLELAPKVVGKISWSQVPGLVFLEVPETNKDKYMTVLKLTLDKRLELYRGQGGL